MSSEEYKKQRDQEEFKGDIIMYSFVVLILFFVLLVMMILRMKRVREEKKFQEAQVQLLSNQFIGDLGSMLHKRIVT